MSTSLILLLLTVVILGVRSLGGRGCAGSFAGRRSPGERWLRPAGPWFNLEHILIRAPNTPWRVYRQS